MKFTKAQLFEAIGTLRDFALDSYDDDEMEEMEDPIAFLEGCIEAMKDIDVAPVIRLKLKEDK